MIKTDIRLLNGLKAGEVFKGFYFNIGKKEFFCKTAYKNKSNILAGKILDKLEIQNKPATRAELIYYLLPAFCEVKTAGEFQYFNIYGKNFFGFGPDNADSENIVIFEI